MMERDGIVKFIILNLFAFSSIAFFALRKDFRGKKRSLRNHKLVPLLKKISSSNNGCEIEKFSHYVVRQLGFNENEDCSQLHTLVNDYLKKPKECEQDIFSFFANDPNANSLFVKFVQELDKCILGYFAFHWTNATKMVTQALSNHSEPKKFKNFVMAATREQRFKKMAEDLKVTRVFSTLVNEMKAIGVPSPTHPSHCTEVMAPVELSQRSPVLLFMGGGMGAGKSTVLKDIMKESFWSLAGAKAVVVEADAFKETDVLYRALSARGHHDDMLQTAELVHQCSTDAASSLLVTALNEGRDVIMDGTLSWVPFVQQTISMARNVHRCRYRMGVGYKVEDDGTVTENYWEEVKDDEMEENTTRKPYRVEIVGVVCDAYLAVIRGIRRAIMVGRAVRVSSQLKSHKRFAEAFPKYLNFVDSARLYSTNAMGGSPKLIGWKDGESKMLVDPDEIGCLKRLCELNENADSIYDVYPQENFSLSSDSIWNEVVSSERVKLQQELKNAIKTVQSLPSP